MINIMSKSGHTTYGLTEYVLDEEKEVNDLSVLDAPGSTAYIIATGNSYILSGGSRTWKKMKLASVSGSGSSAETEAQIAELEAQVADQEKTIDNLNSTITKQEGELEVIKEQHTQLSIANESLEKENNELKTKNDILLESVESTKSDLNIAKAELATANEKVEKLSDVKVEGNTLVLPDDLIDIVEEG